jgi:hypothetical protein
VYVFFFFLFSFSFFSSFSLPIFGGRHLVGRRCPLETSIVCSRIVLFPGSYEVIFIPFLIPVSVLIIDYCKFGCTLLVTLCVYVCSCVWVLVCLMCTHLVILFKWDFFLLIYSFCSFLVYSGFSVICS